MACTDDGSLSDASSTTNGFISPSHVLPDGKALAGPVASPPKADTLTSVLKHVAEVRIKMPGKSTRPVEAAQQATALQEDSAKSNNECGAPEEVESGKQTDSPADTFSPQDNECALKLLYEGPPKCRCCINWVEQYPDDLRESVEEKAEIKAKAIVARVKKNHEDDTPLALDSIVVQNDDLKAFLAELFQGYQGITLKLKKLVLKAPFHPFFYQWARFREMKERAANEHSPASLPATLLYDLLGLELQPLIDEVDDLVKNGVITYKLLWAIFKPFQRLYQNHHSHDRMHVYQDSRYVKSDKGNYFQVRAKFVDWDGKRFGYNSTIVAIPEFVGTQPICDLDIYPFDRHPSPTKTRQALLERGKKFRELCAVQHKSYTGPAAVPDKTKKCYQLIDIDERVVLDTLLHREKAELKQGPLEPLEEHSFAPELDLEEQEHNSLSEAGYNYGLEHTVPPWFRRGPGHNPIVSMNATTRATNPSHLAIPELEEEQLVLCSSVLAGYALKSKTWALLTDIGGVRPIHWNQDAFSSLVLPASHRELVLSFVEAQISGDVQFDDIVEGKGLGLLMLLAGEPGLGKTLTAEAVAEKVQKPLYLLSAGELGRDAGTVESRLKDVLEMTSKWNAVLLLDECDVFLEERNSARLDHNATVAVFLRLVEYHKGVLIMTTNRADAIDPAFQSRIHLTLRYPGLSPQAKTTIWRQFIQGTKWAPGNTFTDEQYQKLAALPMNGREIKNIVKTGFLLASRDKSPLGLEHLKKVLDATRGETLQ